MAAKTTPARGFRNLPCIRCGEVDQVTVALHDVGVFTCEACEENFTMDDVCDLVAQWGDVIAWVRTAPVRTAPVVE